MVRLVVLKIFYQGRLFKVCPFTDDQISAGSGEGLALRLNGLAPWHIVIERKWERYTVFDLGSETGTFVNGKRIAGETELSSGSHFQIGPYQIQFFIGEPPQDFPAPPPPVPVTAAPVTGLPPAGSLAGSPAAASAKSPAGGGISGPPPGTASAAVPGAASPPATGPPQQAPAAPSPLPQAPLPAAAQQAPQPLPHHPSGPAARQQGGFPPLSPPSKAPPGPLPPQAQPPQQAPLRGPQGPPFPAGGAPFQGRSPSAPPQQPPPDFPPPAGAVATGAVTTGGAAPGIAPPGAPPSVSLQAGAYPPQTLKPPLTQQAPRPLPHHPPLTQAPLTQAPGSPLPQTKPPAAPQAQAGPPQYPPRPLQAPGTPPGLPPGPPAKALPPQEVKPPVPDPNLLQQAGGAPQAQTVLPPQADPSLTTGLAGKGGAPAPPETAAPVQTAPVATAPAKKAAFGKKAKAVFGGFLAKKKAGKEQQAAATAAATGEAAQQAPLSKAPSGQPLSPPLQSPAGGQEILPEAARTSLAAAASGFASSAGHAASHAASAAGGAAVPAQTRNGARPFGQAGPPETGFRQARFGQTGFAQTAVPQRGAPPRFSAEGHSQIRTGKGYWKTFAPPEKIKNLDEHLNFSVGNFVEVLISWKDRILHSFHFSKKGLVRLGSAADCEVPVSNLLGVKKYKLLNIDSGAKVFLDQGVKGALIQKTGENRRTVHPLTGSQSLILKPNEIIRLDFRNLMRAYIRLKNRPKPAGAAAGLFNLSFSETAVLVFSFLTTGLLLLYAALQSPAFLNPEEDFLEKNIVQATVKFEKAKPRVADMKLSSKTQAQKRKAVIKVKKKKKASPKPVVLKKAKKQKIVKKAGIKKKSKSKPGKIAAVAKGRKPPSKKKVAVGSARPGGSLKTGKAGASAKTVAPDPTKTGLLGVFGGGGKLAKLDKGASGVPGGGLLGLAESATGFAGTKEGYEGTGVGTKTKELATGGKGSALVGIKGIKTKGRGGSLTGGRGTGGSLGSRGTVNINIGADDIEVEGEIDKAGIVRVIRRNRVKFDRCYQFSLQQQSSLEGTLKMEWQILSNGSVRAARPVRDNVGSASLANCMKRVLSGLRFPPPPAGQIPRVQFKFGFSI